MKACLFCLVAFLLGSALAWGQERDVLRGQTETDGFEVLTRGPAHEAFAETVMFDPKPGIVVPKAPPVAIEELPPDVRPEGTNVAWRPGCWANGNSDWD